MRCYSTVWPVRKQHLILTHETSGHNNSNATQHISSALSLILVGIDIYDVLAYCERWCRHARSKNAFFQIFFLKVFLPDLHIEEKQLHNIVCAHARPSIHLIIHCQSLSSLYNEGPKFKLIQTAHRIWGGKTQACSEFLSRITWFECSYRCFTKFILIIA